VSEAIDIAVVGATGEVGRAVLAVLAERGFPSGRVYPLASAKSAAGRVEFKGAQLRVRDLTEFDFSQAQLAFFCTSASVSRAHVPSAAACGCVAIDHSGAFSTDPTVPLVVPEVNRERIGAYRERGILASPGATTVLLAMVLKPLRDAVGIERVNVVTFEAVSGSGRAAVEELAGQTANLLNLKPIRSAVFPKQIAFNVLPQVGAFQDDGYTEGETRLWSETRRVLGEEALPINVTATRVPVFYGHAAVMHLELRRPLDAAEARACLRETPGLLVLDEPPAHDYPTAVTDGSGGDLIHVARVREDASHPRGLDLWALADNLRRGAALNSVGIAEVLVGDYF
jgi:aspartate-semialdehyde dehydrogenase